MLWRWLLVLRKARKLDGYMQQQEQAWVAACVCVDATAGVLVIGARVR